MSMPRMAAFASAIVVWTNAGADTTGTGFFVSADGLLVTNYHVIEGAKQLVVRAADGRIHGARAIAVDRANDLAILQVEGVIGSAIIPVRHSSTVLRGNGVFTIGFPMPSIQGSEPKVTSGLVSSLSGLDDDPTQFQVSVPVQMGNSGGPLIASDATAVGVVTAKLNAGIVQKATGDIPQNVNFAVKSSYLIEMFALRAIEGRVRVVTKPGRPLSSEEIVRRTERAVAIILGVTNIQHPASLEPAPPTPSIQPQASAKSEEVEGKGSFAFGGVVFEPRDGYLVVAEVQHRTELSSSTLKYGDRLLGCYNYSFKYRPRSIEDFGSCTAPSAAKGNEASKQYLFKVERLGDTVPASIVIRQAR